MAVSKNTFSRWFSCDREPLFQAKNSKIKTTQMEKSVCTTVKEEVVCTVPVSILDKDTEILFYHHIIIKTM